jgi:hypothetical protein
MLTMRLWTRLLLTLTLLIGADQHRLWARDTHAPDLMNMNLEDLLVDRQRINDNIDDQAFIGTDFPVDVDLLEQGLSRGLRVVISGYYYPIPGADQCGKRPGLRCNRL